MKYISIIFAIGFIGCGDGQYAPIPCEQISKDGLWVVLVAGQSNAANFGETMSEGGSNTYMFDGENCLPLADNKMPLDTNGGGKGSVWTRLAPKIIASGLAKNVIFVNIAVGGTAISQWTWNGNQHYRIDQAFAQMKAHNFEITHFFWHQGEADSTNGVSYNDYLNNLFAVVESVRQQAGKDIPTYIAQATICANIKTSYEPVFNAQHDILSLLPNMYAGPNTDTITDRYDGCHMSTESLERHADLWMEKLR